MLTRQGAYHDDTATTAAQSQTKAKAVPEALRGVRTVNGIASDPGVHPVMITRWKEQALNAFSEIFPDSRAKAAALYEEIARLKVELD
jgi:transposase